MAETVLEEITITTSIYIHKQRKAEREALAAAKRAGQVIHLEPGAAMMKNEPKPATPAKRELPSAVEL